jgi:predicted metal-binding protein
VALENIFVSQELLAKISYEEVKRVVFIPSCISCHGQEGNINLEDFENTRRHLEAIKSTTLLSRKMPKAPFASLNQTQLQYLSTKLEIQSSPGIRIPLGPQMYLSLSLRQ